MAIPEKYYGKDQDRYWVGKIERDAAEATGLSYYTMLHEPRTAWPEPWASMLVEADAYNDAAEIRNPRKMPLVSAAPFLSEWELRDGTAE